MIGTGMCFLVDFWPFYCLPCVVHILILFTFNVKENARSPFVSHYDYLPCLLLVLIGVSEVRVNSCRVSSNMSKRVIKLPICSILDR